jgi:hypothetical protein
MPYNPYAIGHNADMNRRADERNLEARLQFLENEQKKREQNEGRVNQSTGWGFGSLFSKSNGASSNNSFTNPNQNVSRVTERYSPAYAAKPPNGSALSSYLPNLELPSFLSGKQQMPQQQTEFPGSKRNRYEYGGGGRKSRRRKNKKNKRKSLRRKK